jgi:hypothetical protein
MSIVPYPFQLTDMTGASQVLRSRTTLPAVTIVKNGVNLPPLPSITLSNVDINYLISIQIDVGITGGTITGPIDPTVDYGFFYYLTPINISTQPQPPVLDIFFGSKTLVSNIFSVYNNSPSPDSNDPNNFTLPPTYVMCKTIQPPLPATQFSPVNLYLNVVPYNLDIPSGVTLSFTPTIEMVAPIQSTITTINSSIASGTTYSNIVTIY